MYEISVLGVSVMMLISGIVYVWQTATHRAHPVLATWILMLTLMSLSFWMYWANPQKTWTGNIAVISGLINVIIILSGVTWTHIRNKTITIAFEPVQKICLGAGGIVVIVWSVTKEPLTSYVLVQIIGLIAYFATIKKLWKLDKSTEPMFNWAAVLIASLLAIYPAWIRKDIFAYIYLVRTIPSTTFMVGLIWYKKRGRNLLPLRINK